MHGQLPQEPSYSQVFSTDNANVFLKVKHRLQNSMHDGFREGVGNPAHETDRFSTRQSLCGIHELSPNGEDLFGVAQRDMSELGEYQPAALSFEEVLAEDLLQPMNLGADR